MQFVFDFTAYYYNTPVFYKVSKLNNQEYIAEPRDQFMTPFIVKKQSGYWTSAAGNSYRHAMQIGATIDKFQAAGINK